MRRGARVHAPRHRAVEGVELDTERLDGLGDLDRVEPDVVVAQ